jgi:hypothetical protein
LVSIAKCVEIANNITASSSYRGSAEKCKRSWYSLWDSNPQKTGFKPVAFTDYTTEHFKHGGRPEI